MRCSNTIVPGFEETSKIKNPGLEAKIEKLFLNPIRRQLKPQHLRESDVGPTKKQNKAFKKWFGDSKVVDEKGNPMVVHHGSPVRGFTKFQIKKANPNDPDSGFNGFWFTTNKQEAEGAGKFPWGRPNAPGAQTRGFYLSIKNPITRDKAEKIYKELQDKGIYLNRIEMRKELIKRGYDGVLFKDPLLDFNAVMKRDGEYKLPRGMRYVVEDYSFSDHTGKVHLLKDGVTLYRGYEEVARYISIEDAEYFNEGVWVAFNSDQIKSATANTGKYSSKSHIYK